MKPRPDFLSTEVEFSTVEGRHQPVLSNRRGELFAWVAAVGSVAWSLLQLSRNGQISAVVLSGAVLFTLLAVVISYGGWVERNTHMLLTERAIEFFSPLRKCKVRWSQVEELRVSRSTQGWRVRLIGSQCSFQFHSQGQLQFAGFEEMSVGIPQGEQIAAFIRQRAGLTAPQLVDGEWTCIRN